MLNQFEPNVKAIISFLGLLKVKVNSTTVNETMQNHPDWPGLLCISDSFNKWNIANGAGKIEPNKINELPTPFLAYTSDREHPLVIVTEIEETLIHCFSKNYTKLNVVKREDFLATWSGIYLIAEPSAQSGEKWYAENKRKSLIKSLIPASLFTLILLLSVLFIHRLSDRSLPGIKLFEVGFYLQYFLLLVGFIVTSLLLWYEVDKNNPVLQKVCTGIVKGNCNAILTGKQSKLFTWLSWSEIVFFYFSGGLIALLFAGSELSGTVVLLAWLSLLALPYTLFSIYYQWRVAKQWCVLCLSVQGLLLLGGINSIANKLLTMPIQYSVPAVITYVLLYLFPVLLWYSAKPFILRLQEAKNIKREYLRIKFNTEIFDTLLKKQKSITLTADGLGIGLGKPEATNTLIKVCNPYCGPCAKAHPKIEKLLEETTNLKMQIIFSVPNQPTEAAYKPVSHLLAVQEKNKDQITTKKALDDWYLSEKKDYEVFAAKYPMNGELSKQGNKIDAMDHWCKQMGIQVTPTIFLNGYQLPDAYNIEDLQYFLLE